MEPLVIRPNRRVFVVRPVMWTAILGGLAGVCAYLMLILYQVETFGLGVWAMVYVVIVGIVAGLRHVRYAKTSYTLLADRIVHRTGGLFGEATTDLQYRQITQVRLRLPFLEHRLFGTGRLTIMAAGSVFSKVVFEAVDEPRVIYDEVGALMKSRGFSLGRERMLRDEEPGKVASLLDMGSHVTTAVIAIVSVLIWGAGLIIDVLALDGYGGLFGLFSGAIDDYGRDWDVGVMRSALWGLGLIVLGGMFWSLVAMVLHYIDLTRRRYILYEDVVDYVDGFLTETYEFIPIENLSDVEVNEPLLKRVLGVADVMLSCQGAGSHIRFTSMPEARRFKASLEGLIEKSQAEKVVEQGREEVLDPLLSEGGKRRRSPSSRPVLAGALRQERRMHPLRTLAMPVVGLVMAIALVVLSSGVVISVLRGEFAEGELMAEIGLFPLVFVGLFVWQTFSAVVKLGIRVGATRYVISNQKVESSYAFISKRQVEFTMDRITGVVVRRGPLDRLFGTVTVVFSSIGSSVPLKFEHIEDDGDLVGAILARQGFASIERPRSIQATFGLSDWVRAHLPRLLVSSLLFLGSFVLMVIVAEVFLFGAVAVLLGAVAAFAYGEVFYRRQEVEVFEDYIRIGQGVLIREDRYFHFDHLKTVASRQYIGATTGGLTLQAANHGGTIGFMGGVARVHDWVDQTLYAHGHGDEEEAMSTALITERTPLPRNTLLRIGPLAFVLPVLVPWLIWRYIAVKRIFYRVEASRLLVSRGVFYKERVTILFDRIDHVRRTRGVVDKFSKTGAIEAYTVGSPMADVVLFDVPGDDALFRAIDERVGVSASAPSSVEPV